MDSDDESPMLFESTLLLSPIPERSFKRLKKAGDRVTPNQTYTKSDIRSPQSPVVDFESCDKSEEEDEFRPELCDVAQSSLAEETRLDSEKSLDNRGDDIPKDDDGDALISEKLEVLNALENQEEAREVERTGKKNNRKIKAVPKSRTSKERREHVARLQAETQKSLRETRNASFKPAPPVQKSISSLLEKIRQRKRDILSTSIEGKNCPDDCDDDYSHGTNLNLGMNPPNVKQVEGSFNIPEPTQTETAKTATGEVLKNTVRTPLDGTEALTCNVESHDERMEKASRSPREVLPQSLTPDKLTYDSTSDDCWSDEETANKENADPLHMPSPVKDMSAKKFLDDEAEEEDDSDNDKDRFDDDNDEDENCDSDEFDDMIASTFEEKPSDKEVRNQLHQVWLEQHDVAGTEKLLQKLNLPARGDMNVADDNEDLSSEDEKSLDTEQGILTTASIVRMNLRKAKEMMSHEFTDKDDVYISDDEESVRTQTRRLISGEQSELELQVMDTGINQFSGRIRRVNNGEGNKRSKISHYQNATNGSHNFAPLKPFVGRQWKGNLPSVQKQGSCAVRSYIFERNCRLGKAPITESDEPLEKKENATRKTSTKFSVSQHGFNSQKNQTLSVPTPGPSPGEIIRNFNTESEKPPSIDDYHVEAVYASFKVVKYNDTNNSISARIR